MPCSYYDSNRRWPKTFPPSLLPIAVMTVDTIFVSFWAKFLNLVNVFNYIFDKWAWKQDFFPFQSLVVQSFQGCFHRLCWIHFCISSLLCDKVRVGWLRRATVDWTWPKKVKLMCASWFPLQKRREKKNASTEWVIKPFPKILASKQKAITTAMWFSRFLLKSVVLSTLTY